MSSSDRAASLPRRGFAALVLGAAVLALGACTATPLYAPAGMAPGAVQAGLASIAIEPTSGRLAQQLRNDLIFAFTGGGAAPPARYLLSLRLNRSQTQLGVTRIETAPSYSVNLAVSYELREIGGSNRIVSRGVGRGVASFDRSNQAFANVRAEREAENRAAATAADEIRIRLAAVFAAGI